MGVVNETVDYFIRKYRLMKSGEYVENYVKNLETIGREAFPEEPITPSRETFEKIKRNKEAYVERINRAFSKD